MFGLVEMGGEAPSAGYVEAVNRLLCFVLRELSTGYVIPVGYFFARCLKHDYLFLSAVEDAGFQVTYIVTDNHQTNITIFRGVQRGYGHVQASRPLIKLNKIELKPHPVYALAATVGRSCTCAVLKRMIKRTASQS